MLPMRKMGAGAMLPAAPAPAHWRDSAQDRFRRLHHTLAEEAEQVRVHCLPQITCRLHPHNWKCQLPSHRWVQDIGCRSSVEDQIYRHPALPPRALSGGGRIREAERERKVMRWDGGSSSLRQSCCFGCCCR